MEIKKEPILVVMAAGMGSRYGGLKQLDPIGPSGEVILDYSVYDAYRAGFKRVIFIIKHEFEDLFKERIGAPISKFMEVQYACQELNDLPSSFSIPVGRTKPWGTGHAVLVAKNLIDAPFAVINSDDYYGLECYQLLYGFLKTKVSPEHYSMIGYRLGNTASSSGSVTRGLCQASRFGNLISIFECRGIQVFGDKICYSTDQGNHWIPLDPNALVSMNMWGYPVEFLSILEEKFAEFLSKKVPADPLKAEFLLPEIIHDVIHDHQATIQVIPTSDKWCGVTYKEDREQVISQMQDKIEEGIYPKELWK